VIGATAKDRFATALFMGSLLSLSANPVIAGILMDMGLFKSEIGRTIIGDFAYAAFTPIFFVSMAAAAHDAGLIDLRLFVACVLMCVLTTMATGPSLGAIVGRKA